MDVTIMTSDEEPFTMEVGFFDTIHDIKQKLQGCKGWSADALTLYHNGEVLVDTNSGVGVIERYGIVEGSIIYVAPYSNRQQQRRRKRDAGGLRVNVVSQCGRGRAEVAVGARDAVSTLREEVERMTGFPLPPGGGYFFIHRQSVMREDQSFEWHEVADGDEVAVFEGSVTRGR